MTPAGFKYAEQIVGEYLNRVKTSMGVSEGGDGWMDRRKERKNEGRKGGRKEGKIIRLEDNKNSYCHINQFSYEQMSVICMLGVHTRVCAADMMKELSNLRCSI